MKTILLVILFNLANPTQPAQMAHKAFATEEACKTAFIETMKNLPYDPTIKVAAFCEAADHLTAR